MLTAPWTVDDDQEIENPHRLLLINSKFVRYIRLGHPESVRCLSRSASDHLVFMVTGTNICQSISLAVTKLWVATMAHPLDGGYFIHLCCWANCCLSPCYSVPLTVVGMSSGITG